MSHKDDLIEELSERLDEQAVRLTSTLYDAYERQNDLEATIEGLAIESDDRLKELDRVHAVVKTAVDDLRALEDVPARHLFESIGEIVGQLRAVLV